MFVYCIIYCLCHVINSKFVGSYIDAPDWIKNRKATTSPINKNGSKVALNHKINRRNNIKI